MPTKPHKSRNEFWTNFNRLSLQFLVLTLGGAIVTYSFQYFGKIRDEENQQSRFERTNFLELRKHINKLITNRLILAERITARLAGRDFDGAKKLDDGSYDEAVQEWNLNVNQLLLPLKRLEDCKPSPKQIVLASGTAGTTAQSPDLNKEPQNCLLNYFYDIPVDQAQISSRNAYVENPRSVHFAFRNAHLTLDKIFQSKWADCRDLIDAVLERQLDKCKVHPATQTSDKISDRLNCIDEARTELQQGYEACSREDGADLLPKLQRELKYVRNRWELLEARFFELERKYGTARSPNFLTSRR